MSSVRLIVHGHHSRTAVDAVAYDCPPNSSALERLLLRLKMSPSNRIGIPFCWQRFSNL